MNKEIQSRFIFRDYKIDNIKFNLNSDYINQDSIELDIKFGTEIKLINPNLSQVKLSVLIFDKYQEENYPFILSLDVIGKFEYEFKDEDIDKEKIIKLCKINGTAALFPYMRSAISDITKIANVDPLVLPLINVYNMIKQSEENKDKE